MAKIVGIDLGTTNSKKKKLFMRRFFGSKFNSHNIGNNNQSTSNPEQGIANFGTIKYLIELLSIHRDNLSNIMARTKLTILKNNALVNAAASRLTNPGPININPNQPADRLPLIPESTLKNDFLTAFTLAKIQRCYNNFGLRMTNLERRKIWHKNSKVS